MFDSHSTLLASSVAVVADADVEHVRAVHQALRLYQQGRASARVHCALQIEVCQLRRAH